METANVVLVTNVGQGFGRAVALAFGRTNHDVVCADRDVELASKTAAEIEEAGGQAIPIQADMTTHMDVLNAFHKVYEIFGDLNGVVHVVAQESGTPFANLTESEFAELLEEDLKSAYLVLKVAAQVIADAWVVLVGPPASARAPQMRAVRAALTGLASGVSEGHRGLRVNTVFPTRSAADPTHDAALVETVTYLGSQAARGLGGQSVEIELPPPPRIVESLLPEVRAALDESVRQDDLEASLYDEDDDADEGPESGADPVAVPPGTVR